MAEMLSKSVALEVVYKVHMYNAQPGEKNQVY